MPRRLLLITAALAVCATPAAASEGPGGTPLPDTLVPVTIPRNGPAKHQRVMAAKVTPRRVAHGRHSRLRVALAAPGRMQVTLHRRVGGRLVRVSTRMIAAPLGGRVVRLPSRLRRGHYRVTVVALDGAGKRSRPVRRALVVV